MAYICQNCGVIAEGSESLCNPINEEYNSKACSMHSTKVCDEKSSAMVYSCVCGNISANPQHLCRPQRMSQ